MENGTTRIGEIFNYGILHLEWPTALFIVVVFFLTMLILHNLLFRPILRTLEARESKTNSDNKQRDKTASQLEQLNTEYQTKLIDIRDQIKTERQNALEEALEEAKQIVEKSRTSINQSIEEAEKALNEERKSALSEAESLIEGLAQIIKTRVLAK